MTSRWVGLLGVVVFLMVGAAPGWAEGGRGGELALRLDLGIAEPTNSRESYELVYGGPAPRLGVGVSWRAAGGGLGLEALVTWSRARGEAVRPRPGGGFEGTGRRLTLDIVPVVLRGSWRFRPGRSWRPYVGAGVGWWTLREARSGGSAARRSALLYAALVGLEWRRAVAAGWSLVGELEWTSVPGGLGDNPQSTSAALGESDGGGLALSVGWRWRLGGGEGT